MHSSTLSSPRTRSFPPYPIEIMEKMVKTGLPLMTDSDTELTCHIIRATFLEGKIERCKYLYFLHFLQEEALRAFMFQLDWAKRSLWRQQPEAQRTGKSVLQPESVDKTSVLLWEEHCHECAPPLCYQTCSLYVARADQKCARFVYGIYPNLDFSGEFGFGADIFLRRWGKLETALYGRSVSLRSHRLFQAFDRGITRLVNLTSDVLQPVKPKRRQNGALVLLRNAFMATFFSGKTYAP